MCVNWICYVIGPGLERIVEGEVERPECKEKNEGRQERNAHTHSYGGARERERPHALALPA